MPARLGRSMTKPSAAIVLVLALALAALGCGTSKDDTDSTTAVTASDCTPAQLETQSKGQLTIATDKPAYPPYFVGDDPSNGKGFESAVGYAIGKQLGYPAAKVKWTVEPFDSSYAPGPKDFDFDVNEISITPVREKAVDFSAPYYKANQAVVALKGSDAAQAKSLADLKDAKIGVQINTTSLSAVEEEIEPSSRPEVFNNSGDVVTALKNGQVEAVVVDLPTALYLTSVQVPEATVVGQFGVGSGEEWGALLAKGASLTSCVSWAIGALEKSGELEAITQRWMSQAAGAPELH